MAKGTTQERVHRGRWRVDDDVAGQQVSGKRRIRRRIARVAKANDGGDPRKLGDGPAVMTDAGEQALIEQHDRWSGRIQVGGRGERRDALYLHRVPVT